MKKGFTLTEVMITLGVIGTLAMIAIPQYTNYTARAQVVEAIGYLDAAKKEALDFKMNNGVYPRTVELTDILTYLKTPELVKTKYLNLVTTEQPQGGEGNNGSNGNGNINGNGNNATNTGNTKTRGVFNINLRFKKEGLSSLIADKHLTLSYNGSVWSCVSEDIKDSALPSVCEGI